MPIYEYECTECGEEQEHLVKNDKVEVKCKECDADHDKLKRLMSTGTNFKLMGRGWPSGPQ
jgi:putative FmdB family regulatory protein